jgi:hypothetical protein
VFCTDICRIGEKFLEWTDETPSLDEILASVSLYWLTDTFPGAIYPYREVSYPVFFCVGLLSATRAMQQCSGKISLHLLEHCTDI